MWPISRRRAFIAAALAVLFVIPLPVATQSAAPEPVAMQVAKRGDAKNRVTIETQNFTVVFSEVGARIQEFRNRDAAYPRRERDVKA